jgi:DNA primase
MDAEAINFAAGGRVVAVAPLGTALTAGQLATLNQVAPLTGRQVLTAMDNDEAGRAASVRAFDLLADAGVTDPQALTLPAGRNDPAETLARDGAEGLAAGLRQDTHPLADTVVDDVLDRWPAPNTPEYPIGALDEVAPTVAALPAHRREEQITRVAGRLNLDEHTATGAIIDHLPSEPTSAVSPLGLPPPPVLGVESQEGREAQIERGGPFANVTTAEIRQQVADHEVELRRLLDRHQLNSAQISRLADHPGVLATEQRMSEGAMRAEQIDRYRQEWSRAESLHAVTRDRAAEIVEVQAGIADGGRRVGRREADRLAELQAQQRVDHATIRRPAS